MPDISPIADLRRAADLLEASGDPAALRFATCLRRYDTQRGAVALGKAARVDPLPGKTSWWEDEALQSRRLALCVIRDRDFAGLGVTAASREIAKLMQRYRRSSKPDPLLDVVTANGRCYLKERRIREYLGNEDALLVARTP